jgi:hypothetical protein
VGGWNGKIIEGKDEILRDGGWVATGGIGVVIGSGWWRRRSCRRLGASAGAFGDDGSVDQSQCSIRWFLG